MGHMSNILGQEFKTAFFCCQFQIFLLTIFAPIWIFKKGQANSDLSFPSRY